MKIMIRLPNWVGDAVMAEPALRELRRIFRDAHITFVARRWVAGLFEDEGLADALITVTDARSFIQSTRRFIRDARELKREKFDCAVLLTNSFGTALTARAARIPQIVGYATDARRALLHTVTEFEKDYQAKHQIYYYLNIASELEKKITGTSRVDFTAAQPRLRASPESRAKAARLLAEFDFELNAQQAAAPKTIQNPKSKIQHRKLLAINPGATNSRAKQWLASRFAETADRLAAQDGLQTILVGAAGDVEVANEVQRLMQTPVVNLAGQTSIAELTGVLAMSSLMISNDTGAAHVAAALRVPTVVVFGPTAHFATRPFSDAAKVVRHTVDCSPCVYRDCPIDHRCMTGVEVDEVYENARRLLNQTTGEVRFEV
jgi:heptosyltransferase-2